MTDFATARRNMVASQVRTDDVTDARLQDAMIALPRQVFVPPAAQALAYASQSISLGGGRALMEPRSLAKLAQAAAIRKTDEVLVIGAATGYDAAVLSKLAAAVVALEEDPGLAAEAQRHFVDLGLDNAAVVTGPLPDGYPDQGPYDVIFIDGGIEELPQGLVAQLKDGGRLATIEMDGPLGKARIYRKVSGTISGRTVFDATAPVLPGFARARVFAL